MFDFRLRAKITIVMILVMVLILIVNDAIFGWDFTRRYTAALQSEAMVHANSLSREVKKARPSGNSIKSIDNFSARCLEIVENNPNIGYSIVTDSEGLILHHSNKDEIGNIKSSKWIEKVRSDISENNIIQKEHFSGKDFYDITIPMTGGGGTVKGYVSVGLYEDVIGDAMKGALTLVLPVAAISLLLVILTAIAFGRTVVAPLNRLIEMVREIATGGGDLTKRLNIKSKDEVGELAHWFDRFMDNIQGMVGKFSETTAKIHEATVKISDSSNSVREGSDAQTLATEETSSAIDEMNANFREVASNIENLTATTEEASSSILEMAASIEEVAHIAEDVSSSVDDTSSSIEEMTVAIKEVAGIAGELSSSADNTVSSVSQINASINEVEKGAKDSAVVAHDTFADAEKGMLAVEKTIVGMNKIKLSVHEAADIIKKLGGKSVDIGKILNVIDEVAEQTNLLALNAAIIAAQAGEHGKSFAVVADEIKDLAERTATSTNEIATLIKSVQSESGNAVKSMEVGLQTVEDGVKLSKEAGNSLEKILEGAVKSKDMIDHIVNATVEQLRGSQQVKEAMEDINYLVIRIASATQEQQKGGELIIKATETMKDSTSHVKRATQEQSKGGKQITNSIENITNMTSFVNRATHEQTTGVKLVVDAIEKIKKLSEDYGVAINGMNEAVESLSSQTEVLGKEIENFKV